MAEKSIRVNGIDIPIFDEEITGQRVKELAGIPDDEQSRRQVVQQRPDRNELVSDHEPIRIADGDVFTHHARHTKA